MAAASSTAPSTPEPKVKTAGLRSFTMPPSLSSLMTAISPTQADINAAQGVETLFVHPSCKIIKFKTSVLSSSSPNSRGLRWSSPTETTVAAGSLEIYRVPGSVSFLHSGELLHAIMPRSQCWCVDGVSKFALRVLPDTYYRIELPGESAEDLDIIEEFKKVLGKVMHYERTACPFARSTMEEELPELEDSRNKTFSRSDKAKQWQLDRTFGWKGDSGITVQLRPATKPWQRRKASEPMSTQNSASQPLVGIDEKNSQGSPVFGADDGEISSRTRPKDILHQPQPNTVNQKPSSKEVAEAFSSEMLEPPTTEAQTASLPSTIEPDYEMHRIAPEAAQPLLEPETDQVVEPQPEQQLSSSHLLVDDPSSSTMERDLTELKPLQPIPTDMPPSPPDSSAGLSATDEVFDIPFESRLPAKTFAIDTEESTPAISSQQMPEPVSDATAKVVSPFGKNETGRRPSSTRSRRRSSQSSEDPFAAIQARILARRSIGGTTSFYPPVTRESTSCSTTSVSSSVSSRSRMPIAQQRNIASALVQKACTVFLGPPAYLVAMMLRIAARFANGKFGSVYGIDSDADTHDGVPGTFHVRNASNTSEEEDDFGVALNSPIRAAAAKNLRERRTRERSDVD